MNKLISKKLVTGLKISATSTRDPICEPCIAGKQHRPDVPKVGSRASKPLERVYLDVHGPLPLTGRGYRYWLLIVDCCTRDSWGFCLKQKSQVTNCVKRFKAAAEAETGHRLLCVHMDQGGENTSNAFKAFCEEHGIRREFTMRNEPHQNGVVERLNRTVAEGVVSMLQEANLPASWWDYAFCAFLHAHNRSFTSAVPEATPHQAFTKKKPDVSLLRVFGCTAYVNVRTDKRSNIESHTMKCIFVGYAPEQKGWLFYHPETRKLMSSNAAIFDERYFPGLKRSDPTNARAPDGVDWSVFMPAVPVEDAPKQVGEVEPGVQVRLLDVEPAPESRPPSPVPRAPSPPPAVPRAPSPAESLDPLDSLPRTPPPGPRRGTRERHKPRPSAWKDSMAPPRRPKSPVPVDFQTPRASVDPLDDSLSDSLSDDELLLKKGDAFSAQNQEPEDDDKEPFYMDIDQGMECAFAALADSRGLAEPHMFAEAMRRDDTEQWLEAAVKEIEALVRNKTWELVPLPAGRRAIGSRWVFKVKRNADGSIERYKARFCGKGFLTATWRGLSGDLCVHHQVGFAACHLGAGGPRGLGARELGHLQCFLEQRHGR